MSKTILIVDDEVQILKALIRAFLDSNYEVLTAESGKEALDILSSNEIDMIISDMRMPNMDGYQLLSEVKLKYPEILRVILSGYSDENVIFKAILQNVAKLYVLKPWENEKLIKLVDQIFETEDSLKDKNLISLINSLDKLPTIKSNYQRILSYIETNADIADIARLIEQDQSITTKLLHVANSAFYGVKTGSVKQAVSYLGLINIQNLILSTSIIDALDSNGSQNSYMETLWKHAFTCNKILSFIFESFLCKKLPEVATSAGLLHNIGIVLLLSKYKDKYLKCFKSAEKEGLDVSEIEMETFGVTHQETGGYLLKWWELPFPIVEAALYHHNPFCESIVNKELLLAVHIAEQYSWGVLKQRQVKGFNEAAFNALGINKETFEEKLSKITI